MNKIELIKGDCLETMDNMIERGYIIDAVITDIPYAIDYSEWDVFHNNSNSALGGQNDNMKSKNYKRRGKPINGWSKKDSEIGNEYKEWLDENFKRLFVLTKECSPVLIFSSRRFQHKVAQSLEDNGFIIKDILIWEKEGCHAKAQRINNVLKGRGLNNENYSEYRLGNLKPMYEPIIYAFKPYKKTIVDCFIENKLGSIKCKNDKIPSNIFCYKRENDYHEAQKPTKLIEDLIDIFTFKGHTVLDFTAGSFTTGIACMNTNRNFIGVELDSDYFKTGVERIKNNININDYSLTIKEKNNV